MLPEINIEWHVTQCVVGCIVTDVSEGGFVIVMLHCVGLLWSGATGWTQPTVNVYRGKVAGACSKPPTAI